MGTLLFPRLHICCPRCWSLQPDGKYHQDTSWYLVSAVDVYLSVIMLLVQGYAFVPEGDEEALKEAVYSRGPVAVSLDASHRSFRFYSHGRACSTILLLIYLEIAVRRTCASL